MNSFYKSTILSIVIFVFLFNLSHSFDSQKVTQHFHKLDTNLDNMVDIQEYVKLLQHQDQLIDINEDQNYYRELVGLLYEQYDKNDDHKIDLKEWIQFATDIVDESDPVYQQILEEKNQQSKRGKSGHKQIQINEDF